MNEGRGHDLDSTLESLGAFCKRGSTSNGAELGLWHRMKRGKQRERYIVLVMVLTLEHGFGHGLGHDLRHGHGVSIGTDWYVWSHGFCVTTADDNAPDTF